MLEREMKYQQTYEAWLRRREYNRKWRKTTKGQAMEKLAHAKYVADPTNRAGVNKTRRQHYAGRKAEIASFKNRPCADCFGWFEPCQMDFDHKPGTQKAFSISKRGSSALRAVLIEIKKCDVVCANCHRLRTQKRGATWLLS